MTCCATPHILSIIFMPWEANSASYPSLDNLHNTMIMTMLINITNSANPAITKEVNYPLDSTVTDPLTSISSYFMFR
jgi:hypothetical protein